MVGTITILERWHNDDKYRESLSKIGWTEEQIIQYDELALEDHSEIATREERNRNEKSGPLNQRPDFVEAKREMKRLHDEHVEESQSKRQRIGELREKRKDSRERSIRGS